MTHKPTVEALGIDPGAQAWQRSGAGDGAIEIAFACVPVKVGAESARPPGTQADTVGMPGSWVLMRVAGDPHGRILVFDRHEWECFLDGAKNGEFDDAVLVRGSAQRATPGPKPAAASAPAASPSPQPQPPLSQPRRLQFPLALRQRRLAPIPSLS